MILHSALYWPGSIKENLWSFALDHTVYLWHWSYPNRNFIQIRLDAPKHLACIHVWGCPAYVLHPTLQDGKKIPSGALEYAEDNF